MNDKEEYLTFEYYLVNYSKCVDEEDCVFITPSSYDDYISFIWAITVPSSDY
ncbi:MAG: hypothetical protein IKT40_01670 [Bacilli bacterium]|nr:hypothetical protein [Bacilli bacterium]